MYNDIYNNTTITYLLYFFLLHHYILLFYIVYLYNCCLKMFAIFIHNNIAIKFNSCKYRCKTREI